MNKYFNSQPLSAPLSRAKRVYPPGYDPRFIGNERKYLLDAMDTNFVSSVGRIRSGVLSACVPNTRGSSINV